MSDPAVTVYPVFLQDAARGNRVLVSRVLWFNDVIDTEKICSSLSKLLEIGDWRKLAGRLRKNPQGEWESVALNKATSEVPDFEFIEQAHNVNIRDHPLGKLLPASTPACSTQPINDAIRPLLVPPSFPADFDDLVRKQWPQLTVFTSSFDDATLSLLRNWSLVLAEKEDQVEAVLGAKIDSLDDIGKLQDHPEPHALEAVRMGLWAKFSFVLRFVWRMFTQPKPESRFIYITESAFETLKDRSVQEAKDAAPGKDVFLTDGDVVAAWLARLIIAGTGNQATCLIADMVNVRLRLSELKATPGTHLQNMLSMVFTVASKEDVQSSVGSLALLHRRALTEQLTEPQVAGMVHATRSAMKKNRLPPLFFGDSSAVPVVFNNIGKTSYISAADFSPAVVRCGDKSPERRNPSGSPVFRFSRPLSNANVPGFCFLWGRDFDNGLWVSSCMSPKSWELLERDMATLA